MRTLRRFLPFTTVSGAAWFALRHRRPILDWGLWTLSALPRAVQGEHEDVLAEARIRARLQGDERLAGEHIEVTVSDGRALLRGQVEKGRRDVVVDLAERQKGVEVVDELTERPPPRRRRRAA
jgi:hypothetical protein